MKILLIVLCAFLLCVQSSFCQTQKGIKITDIQSEYVELIGVSYLYSREATILIDYGQPGDIWSSKGNQLIKENGAPLIFQSMMGAINYFSEHGFEFVNAYAINLENRNVYHYMMRRKKE